MSDDARVEDGVDVLEAILRAELPSAIMLTFDPKGEEGQRFGVAVVHGTTSTREFKGAELADAVEQWRAYKLPVYQRAVEVLRR